MNKRTPFPVPATALAAFAVAGLALIFGGGNPPSADESPRPSLAPAALSLPAMVPVESPSDPASATDQTDVAERLRVSTEERLRQVLASDDPQVRDTAIQYRLRNWARNDAPAAARFALEFDDGALRSQAMRVVAQTWGLQDAAAAADWAATLPDEIERRAFLGAVCIGLAAADPAEGVQMADKLDLRDDGVLENLTAQWAARDGAAALTWVYQRPAGPDRDRLMQRIAIAGAQTDPAWAARLVVEQIPAGPEQAEAVISVVNQWAGRDPVGVAAWVDDFPPGVLRDRALSELRGGGAR